MANITVAKAAELLGWDVTFLRVGLQQDKYDFGIAVKGPKSKRYAYKIYPQALKRFITNQLGREVDL